VSTLADRPAVPLADAPRLDGAARRTTVVRLGLAALAVALVVAVALAARRPPRAAAPLVQPGKSTIVVLDLSASVSSDTASRMGATLGRLAASGGGLGLVVFSDVAYEALPPGTPASALRPMAPMFATQREVDGFPINPWTRSFSSGTSISAGIDRALAMLRAQRAHGGSVLLVSDLADAPTDTERLTASVLDARREGVQVQAIGLNPARADADFFRRLLVQPGSVSLATLPGAGSPEGAGGSHAFPLVLVVVAAALLLLLAVNELACARLTWRANGGEP
jgi:hypothetical protein